MSAVEIRFAFVNNTFAPKSTYEISYSFGQLSAASAVLNDVQLSKIASTDVRFFDGNWLSSEALFDKLSKFQPHFIGFTTYSEKMPAIRAMIRRVKPACESAKIIVGGPFATFCPDKALSFLEADVALRGEVEKSLPAFLSSVAGETSLDEVEGLVLRGKTGKVLKFARSEKIASLSQQELENHWIDWNLLKRAEEENGVNYSCLRFVSSRGCHGKCTFCAKPHGSVFRAMSPQKTVEEVLRALEVVPKRQFVFDDDCFAADGDRAIGIAKLFEETGLNKKVEVSLLTRVDSFFGNGVVDRELVAAVGLLNARDVSLGAESLSRAEIERFGKGDYSAKDVFELCRAFAQDCPKVYVRLFVILSNLETQPKDLLENLLNLLSLLHEFPKTCGMCYGPHSVAYEHTKMRLDIEQNGLTAFLREDEVVLPRDAVVRRVFELLEKRVAKEKMFKTRLWSGSEPERWKESGFFLLLVCLKILLEELEREKWLLEGLQARADANRLRELRECQKQFLDFEAENQWVSVELAKVEL